MLKNISDTERVFRFVSGATMAYKLKGLKRIFLGVVPMLEGLTGFCPFYRVLGINTRGKGPKLLAGY